MTPCAASPAEATILSLPPLTLFRVSVGASSANAARSQLEKALGLALPVPGRLSGGRGAALWESSGDILVIAEPDAGRELRARLNTALAETVAPVAEMSAAVRGLEPARPDARGLLGGGMIFDLSEKPFPADATAILLLFGIRLHLAGVGGRPLPPPFRAFAGAISACGRVWPASPCAASGRALSGALSVLPMRALVPALSAFLLLLSPVPAFTQPAGEAAPSGLPVPRFASLKAGEANMRTGPGDQYPISWTYKRKGLPLEITKDYGIWRQVRDPDGTSGWMNKALLSGDRMAMVTGAVRPLYAEPDVGARIAWRAEPGVVGRILFCAGEWCRIGVDGKSGYVLRQHIWGVYRTEVIG